LIEKIETGRIASRPRKACNKTQLHWILADAEDDRNRRGRSFGRKRGSIGERDDHGHATAHEIRHERRQTIVLAIQPVVLNHYVLALDVAGFAEGFAERNRLAHGCLGRPALDEAHNRHRRLLSARREWPHRRRATERDYELSPSNVDCHVTLPKGVMQRSGRYHTWTCCAAGFQTGQCRLGVIKRLK